jgi:hypothetical protein
MKKFLFFIFLLFAVYAFAILPKNMRVTLAWDHSPDTNVIGYFLYYRTNNQPYTMRVDTGYTNLYKFTNLYHNITYYFIATAYSAEGIESEPSNEVSYTHNYVDSVNLMLVSKEID